MRIRLEETTFTREKKKKRSGGWNVSRLIAGAFLAVILLGTLLLSLPVASRDGTSCGLVTALFTATSATCVTGLALADTWVQWSGFGQIVLLGLIEIGGLGFMSAASAMLFLLGKRVNMQQQMVIAQSIGSDNVGDAVRMQKRILLGCLSVEALGALILTLRLLPEYDFWRAFQLGVFHSISAFCNAGFDIMGFVQPGSSMQLFASDWIVCLTICALIVIGGLGFLVWDEILRVRQARKWSVYTKLVLLANGALLALGLVTFCLAEWNNPETLGAMALPDRILGGLFQSVTTRTAGFAAMDQGSLTEPGKALTVFFMLIGGSSGSTAGGLKTVTFMVLILFLWTRARGQERVEVFHRTIPDKAVLDAVTIFGIFIGMAFFGGLLICATTPVSFTDGLYEAVSALATVGLSTGITASLSLPAKLLMIVYMYFGRVGVLTISMGLLGKKPGAGKYKYAKTNLLIG